MSNDSTITINVKADITYPVIIGRNLLSELPNHLGGADRIAIIHPGALRESADLIRESLSDFSTIAIEIPEAEEGKSGAVMEFCWTALGQAGFTRNDIIVSVGGGATTDLAGFVAATWLRGIKIVHVPTTLLAMVDAAIGGKTGINTAEGKNLVGAFHSPTAVLCDLNALDSMAPNDYVGGLAEVIKAGFIRDTTILDLVESDPSAAVDPTSEITRDLITRAIQVKADVVGSDLRELDATGVGREILNYGHTFGHAIERVERYSWRHGAAVSVGMMFVANLSHLAGKLSATDLERHASILSSVGLPLHYRDGKWNELLSAMKVDKKSRGDLLRFIVLDGIGRPSLLEGPDPAILVAAYQEIVHPQ